VLTRIHASAACTGTVRAGIFVAAAAARERSGCERVGPELHWENSVFVIVLDLFTALLVCVALLLQTCGWSSHVR
jgi:hypothetical protein